MAVQISANTAEFNKALSSTSNNLKTFTSNIQNIAATVGIAFGVQQVAAFGLEVTKLAGQAEAVQAAFDRLPNSIRLMERLKDATGGTVSELELMKRAVQASNFDISLEALPRLLEFATLRAQQTGQSVDYLVDSIVTGIGRKSKLILDNLGISAVQLSEELKGVSLDASSIGEVAEAVGRIAEKNLVNMAGFSENAATKLQRLSASWENLKVAIGNAANSTGVFGQAIDLLTSTIDTFAADNITTLQKFQTYLVATLNPLHLKEFTTALKESEQALTELQKRQQSFDQIKINQVAQSLINQFNGVSEAINVLTNKIPENEEALLKAGITFDNFDKVMATLNRRLAENQGLNESAIDTIVELNDAIKELKDQNENLTLADSAKIQSNGLLIESYEKLKKVLEDLAKTSFNPRAPGISIPSFTRNLQSPTDALPGQVGIEGTGIQATLDAAKAAAMEVQLIQAEISASTADFVSSMAETIGASLTGTYDFGKGFLLALANFGSQFGKQLIALGVASLAVRKTFANPFAAIAAGTALVIASSLVAGSIKSFNSGGGAVAGIGSGGGSTASSRTSLATNAAQNEFSYETVIRGQDLHVIISNYRKNRNRTSAIGG